jgi:branched-chain amino acid transport system permease protein
VKVARPAQVAILAAAVVAAQLAASAFGKDFYLTQLTMAAYDTLAALGLSILMGYGGQISLGQAGFLAIGGYTSAFLTTFDLSPHRGRALVSVLQRLHLASARPDLFGGEVLSLSPWVAFAVAVVLGATVAVSLGVPVLRLRGHSLAMATLAFGTIVSSIAVGTQGLGAADGLSGVPPFVLLPGLRVGGGAADRVENYYLAWGVVVLAVLLLLNLVHSRAGRALGAIHGDEDAARAMGVDAAALKLRAFVLSGVLAAVAGVMLTHFNGGIGPSEASAMKSVRYVAIVAVGGMGSLWGTLSAGAVLSFLSLRGYFGSYDDAVFGGILVLVMLFSPDGVLHADVRSLAARLGLRPSTEKEEG